MKPIRPAQQPAPTPRTPLHDPSLRRPRGTIVVMPMADAAEEAAWDEVVVLRGGVA